MRMTQLLLFDSGFVLFSSSTVHPNDFTQRKFAVALPFKASYWLLKFCRPMFGSSELLAKQLISCSQHANSEKPSHNSNDRTPVKTTDLGGSVRTRDVARVCQDVAVSSRRSLRGLVGIDDDLSNTPSSCSFVLLLHWSQLRIDTVYLCGEEI